jgi:hypothetical protein
LCDLSVSGYNLLKQSVLNSYLSYVDSDFLSPGSQILLELLMFIPFLYQYILLFC